MRQILIFLAVLFLIVPFVSATTFNKDTSFKQGNINYVFKNGSVVDSFDVFNGGIKINDQSILLSIQGGELTVNIYSFVDANDNVVGFQSNVPQKLTFAMRHDGSNYYFYDGKDYALSTLDLGTDEIKGSFKTFDDTNKTVIYSDLEGTPWYKQNIFEFEINKELRNGIVYGKIVGISYVTATILLFIIIILVFVIKRYGNWAVIKYYLF